jgi:hypothetical protein
MFDNPWVGPTQPCDTSDFQFRPARIDDYQATAFLQAPDQVGPVTQQDEPCLDVAKLLKSLDDVPAHSIVAVWAANAGYQSQSERVGGAPIFRPTQ